MLRRKTEYIQTSEKISDIANQRKELHREIENCKDKIAEIEKYNQDIKNIQDNIDNLRNKNPSLFDLKQKKEIKERLEQLNISKERVKDNFKAEFKVDIDKSKKLTSQLKYELAVNQTSYQRHTDELKSLFRQKNDAEHTYKKIRVSAEKHYFIDKEELDKALTSSIKPDKTNDRYFIIQAERELNKITPNERIVLEGNTKGKSIILDLELMR